MDAAIARSLERTAVVRITLTEPPVGKRKQYDKQGEELKWGRIGRTRASSVLLSLNHELELKLELVHARKNSSKLGSSLT